MLTDAPSVSDGVVSISLAGQSGKKAPFVAYATLDYKGEATITGVVVPFKFATSVIKVNCTGLKANTAITSATLANVNTECKLTLSGSAAPTVSGDVNGTITRTGDAYFADSKVNSEGEAVFQIAVPKLETASSARFLTVSQGSYKFNDRKFTTSSLNPATSVNPVCQLVGLPAGALEGEFSVSATKKVYFSKGNLWADGNNALHFEDAQWKTTPASAGSKDASHVSHFTWSDKVPAAVGNSNSGSNLFCDEMHKQSVDGSANIYYALSKEEWDYLLEERTMTNGKNRYSVATDSGVIIESKTYYGLFLYPDDYSGKEVVDNTETWTWDKINSANIVFLPAAGYRNGDGVYFGILEPIKFFTLRGRYWTSSSGYAESGDFEYYDINIVDGGVATSPQDPGFGDSMRLVRDAQ